MKLTNKDLKKGITLVELLVVIAVIGVLAGMVLVIINPNTYMHKARDAQRKSHIRQIQSALEMYRTDVGAYPGTTDLGSCGTTTDLANGGVTYMDNVPCDPHNTTTAYIYTASPAATCTTAAEDCIGYTLVACLEWAGDPERDAAKDAACSASAASYTVTNP